MAIQTGWSYLEQALSAGVKLHSDYKYHTSAATIPLEKRALYNQPTVKADIFSSVWKPRLPPAQLE